MIKDFLMDVSLLTEITSQVIRVFYLIGSLEAIHFCTTTYHAINSSTIHEIPQKTYIQGLSWAKLARKCDFTIGLSVLKVCMIMYDVKRSLNWNKSDNIALCNPKNG